MWISILSMTEHYPSIWTDFTVPTGVDRQDMIDKICIDCAELELLYYDPDILKYMIRNWSKTEGAIWEKLYATENFEYEPIYNLDVTWTETRTPNLLDIRRPDLQHKRTADLKDTESPTDTTTEAVQGFNDSSFNDSRKTTRGGKIEVATTGTDTYNDTGSETYEKTGSETITTTRQGNQGVTMTQDMIKAEREVDQFSIYDFISLSFKKRFCLMVY